MAFKRLFVRDSSVVTTVKHATWFWKTQLSVVSPVKSLEERNGHVKNEELSSVQSVLEAHESADFHVRMIYDAEGEITFCQAEPLKDSHNDNSSASRTMIASSPRLVKSLAPSSNATESTHVSRPSPSVKLPAKKRVSGRIFSITDFEAVKVLGKGGQGIVLLVKDKVADRLVAMKVIHKKTLSFKGLSAVFDEQDMLKRLAWNPWFLSLLGTFHDVENFYFITEYYSKGSLATEARRRKFLTAEDTRHFAAELVYAVGVMWRHRVLHCDIKAENLLVADNNHLVLADFGLAREFGHTEDERPWRSQEWTRKYSAPVKEEDEFGLKFGALVRQVHDLTCSTAGTPGYVPPEVWRGAGTRSYPGDIWAVGVTLYKMFTGRMPFGLSDDDSYSEFFDKPLKNLVVFDEMDANVSAEARDLIKRMLRINPRARPTIQEVMEHDYFKSINWEMLAKRADLHEEHFNYQEQPVQTEKLAFIPAALPYKKGDDPFPWFEWVSPVLDVRDKSKVWKEGSVGRSLTAIMFKAKRWCGFKRDTVKTMGAVKAGSLA